MRGVLRCLALIRNMARRMPPYKGGDLTKVVVISLSQHTEYNTSKKCSLGSNKQNNIPTQTEAWMDCLGQ